MARMILSLVTSVINTHNITLIQEFNDWFEIAMNLVVAYTKLQLLN